MALATDFPIVYPLPTKTGIVVGIVPGDPSFEIELQRAPQSSGAPGTPVTIARLAPFPATGSFYRDLLPIDGAVYYYRHRHVRTGWTAGAYSPWTRAATAQDMPIIVPLPIPVLADGSVTPDMIGDDGIVTLGPNGREQLIFNGDVELGLSYWLGMPLLSFSPTNADDILSVGQNFGLNTASPWAGSKSLQIDEVGPGTPAMIIQVTRPTDDTGQSRVMLFRVEDDFTFNAQLMAKMSGTGNPAAQITAFCYDKDKAYLGNVQLQGSGGLTSSWALYSGHDVAITANTKYISLGVAVAASSGSATVSLDGISVWRQSRSTDLANASVTGAKLNLGYYDNGTKATNFTIDWVNGDHQRVTLGATPLTITLTNPVSGKRYILDLVQDGTGSRTVVWPGAVKWPGGTAPTLTTTINRVDQIELFYNGTSTDYRGTFTLNFVD